MEYAWFAVVGIAVGWIAGVVVKGRGFGPVGDVIVAVVGALVAGPLFRTMGVTSDGLTGSIVLASVGAVLLLVAVRLIRRS
ncbi:MAG TPA: GlsB/YeaQ/YmgE family stress response membrane protein [Casimicrobiaceae bacterium]|jgi:uncharacterized membrane protein YeaQ/YmgE (transglycosylase-associated protein family)|nr:GlsB/YeaQ/YmgE family stress response membrane protein [Casimicrobiaceae bacterium]